MKNRSQVRTNGSNSTLPLQSKNAQTGKGRLPRKLPADWLKQYIANEFKVVALNDRPIPYANMYQCDNPEGAAEYWRLNIATNPYFNSECECLAVLILNAHRRVKGHQLISIGTLDTLLTHAREIFRTAIVATAAAVILMHNHPSGDASPSKADIQVTRKMAAAGAIIGIEVLDHVIVGRSTPQCPIGHLSLRELGCFRQLKA